MQALQASTIPRENRERLVKAFADKGIKKGLIYLKGGEDRNIYDADTEHLFRQESYFNWTFGVREAGWFGAIDIETGKSTLFMPRLPQAYAVWMGSIRPPSHFLEKYGTDCVMFVDEIKNFIAENKETIYTLNGLNYDSKLQSVCEATEHLGDKTVNNEALHPIITECRVFKTETESKVLREVCRVSSDAHKAAMKACKPEMMEYQLESTLLHHVYFHGQNRLPAYGTIIGSGPNAAVLHYGHAGAPNDRQMQDGDMVLIDFGGDYNGYAADITTTFPVNGKFAEKQKTIYNIVLNTFNTVKAAMKPGVSYVEVHRLALRTHLEGLVKAGLLRGDVDEMMDVKLGAVFQPHGLGHFIGLNVHDVGAGPRNAEFPTLRCPRVLEKGMYLTAEPGMYFINPLLDAALANPEQAKFMNTDLIESYRGFGGVRLEDEIMIVEGGIESYTDVPRTVEEIEAFMA